MTKFEKAQRFDELIAFAKDRKEEHEMSRAAFESLRQSANDLFAISNQAV